MDQKESWPTKVQTLPQPLQTWLHKSYLTQTPDNSFILFVDKHSIDLLQQFPYISQIYSLIYSSYDDVRSLYLTSSSLQDFIKNSKMQIYSVEVIQ